MEAQLMGEEFSITPITAPRQPVSKIEPTQWRWQVTPETPGTHRLYVTIYAVIEMQGEHHERLLTRSEPVVTGSDGGGP
jgi:hypothetical protein